MSPMLHLCPVSGCGALTTGGRCAPHRAERDVRRHRKQAEHGRDTEAWRRLVATAKARAGYVCELCGGAEDPDDPGSKLSGHLDPALEGDHSIATVDDVDVVCLRCHGRVDGARSSRGGGRPTAIALPAPRSAQRAFRPPLVS